MSLHPVRVKRPRTRRASYAHLAWNPAPLAETKTGHRKAAVGIALLLVLFIFAIGRYENIFLPSVQADYNMTYSHTRTPIFTDTKLNGVDTSVILGAYAFSNRDNEARLGDNLANPLPNGVGTCFKVPAGLSEVADQVKFSMSKVGSPTGTARARLYNSNGTCTDNGVARPTDGPLTTSGGLDVSTLTTSFTNKTFFFSPSVTLAANSYYFVLLWYDSGSSPNCNLQVNCVLVGVDASSPTFADGFFIRCTTISPVDCDNLIDTSVDTVFEVSGRIIGDPVTNTNVKWNYNTTCVDLLGPAVAQAAFDYSLGNNLGIPTTLDSFNPVVNDFSRLRPTPLPSENLGVGETFAITGNSWQIGSTQFLMNQTGAGWTGLLTSQIYAVTGTPGVNGKPTGPPLATSIGLGPGSFTTGTATAVTFSFQSGPILSPGSYVVTLNSTGIVTTSTIFPKTWSKNNGFVYSGGRNDAYQPNATSGWLLGGDDLWYKVTGLNTNPGINCNSADIMITKRASNFQVVSARMMEAVMSWNPGTSTPLQNVTMVLRTNGTLPNFREKYNPFNDAQARLIWTACPTFTCIRTLGTNNGTQSLYILHDRSRTINQEGLANDLIINQTAAAFTTSTQATFQVVLNFTGPVNFMENAATTTSQNSASAFQIGEDYYILVMDTYDTTKNPSSSFTTVTFQGGNLPTNGVGDPSLGFWSTPASCADPVNKTPCSTPTATPTFDFNPLDPSSWANSIIKGLTWVFISAIPQAISFLVQATLLSMQIILNIVGNFFGWGNIGDTVVSFINQVVSFFATTMGPIVAQIANFFGPLLTIASFLLSIFTGLISSLESLGLGTAVAVIGEVVTIILRTVLFLGLAYGLLEILLWFVYCADFGLAGYQAWIETSKWLLFGTGIKVLIHIFNFGLDVITALIGLIPKPFVQMVAHRFPRIPLVDITGFPTWPNFDARALCDLDLFSILGIGFGAMFLFWYETTNLPGTIASVSPSVTSLNAFMNVMLIFASVAGIVILIGLPAKLVKGFERCIEMLTERGVTGRISPLTAAGFQAIGERVRERVVPPGKVKLGTRKAVKRFQREVKGTKEEQRKAIEKFQRDIERRKEEAERQEEQMSRQRQEEGRQRFVETNFRTDTAQQLQRRRNEE